MSVTVEAGLQCLFAHHDPLSETLSGSASQAIKLQPPDAPIIPGSQSSMGESAGCGELDGDVKRCVALTAAPNELSCSLVMRHVIPPALDRFNPTSSIIRYLSFRYKRSQKCPTVVAVSNIKEERRNMKETRVCLPHSQIYPRSSLSLAIPRPPQSQCADLPRNYNGAMMRYRAEEFRTRMGVDTSTPTFIMTNGRWECRTTSIVGVRSGTKIVLAYRGYGFRPSGSRTGGELNHWPIFFLRWSASTARASTVKIKTCRKIHTLRTLARRLERYRLSHPLEGGRCMKILA
ncbi:hypothetical protein GG344DRAFT_81218 [Lentinula edodes]|nr:hypothetical protein GG344DRAFT_81218 [Lentinula edodes]